MGMISKSHISYHKLTFLTEKGKVFTKAVHVATLEFYNTHVGHVTFSHPLLVSGVHWVASYVATTPKFGLPISVETTTTVEDR
jgi:hypothetical protein